MEIHHVAGLSIRGVEDPNRLNLQPHRLEEVNMDNDNFVGGYAVPVDPMDDLQCDSCQ